MKTTEGTSATAVGGSALSEGLGLSPERSDLDEPDYLRRLCADGLLWHSEGMPEHTVCVALTQALDEIERLRGEIARVVQWQRDGEALIPSRASWSALFHFGCWWADRPWRKRA